MTTATLPTRKDEAWRYSAVERLQGEALDDWREIKVEAGDSFREILVIADGASNPTELHRWRVTVGEGATCELFAVLASAEYARLEIEVILNKGAHFEFGGITVGGRDTVREFVTRTIHAHTRRDACRTAYCSITAPHHDGPSATAPVFDVRDSRHPCVEVPDSVFVPNDIVVGA